ncbi:hypothetical protein GGS24DRAFT_289368 [Hypoxylon argillaceum]|nr:hypothetical protein GGS24DRAFT_289368 [Hypoxylon argillaceum]
MCYWCCFSLLAWVVLRYYTERFRKGFASEISPTRSRSRSRAPNILCVKPTIITRFYEVCCRFMSNFGISG